MIKEKVNKEDQKILMAWAIKCAKRVLPYFEKEFPNDDCPRKAIEASHAWLRTGVFKMADVRGISLAAHASARAAKKDSAAQFAARAAGQTLATAHVAGHAIAAAWYATKAVSVAKAKQEREWQQKNLPEHLRKMLLSK